MRRVFPCAWAATLLLVAVSGCPKTEKKAHLSGKVMFNNQPVPAGYIQFTPDVKAGGQGMVCVAQIKDGLYDTSKETGGGVPVGPTLIRIAGFDGKVIPGYGQGKQIFNAHELRDTIAEGVSQKDFTVPESAGKNVKIEPTADR